MVMEFLKVFIAIAATAYILFLPGLGLTFALFRSKPLELAERLALSIALSVSVMPLLVFYLNLVGIPINAISILIESTMVIVCSFGISAFLRSRRRIASANK